MPTYCSCGKKNSIEHCLDCKLGGYVHLRHNAVRNTEAIILKEIAHDVKIEPKLQPLTSNIKLKHGTNLDDNARLDVSAIGIFSGRERTFVDVRITNQNSPSNISLSLPDLYKKNEKEKMAKYNDRVIQVEKASFVPLVYSTSGGMSIQNMKFHKRVAQLIADKRNEDYPKVINHIRTRLRFSLIKSIVTSIRGYRGTPSTSNELELSNIDFNLIPESKTYEGF